MLQLDRVMEANGTQINGGNQTFWEIARWFLFRSFVCHGFASHRVCSVASAGFSDICPELNFNIAALTPGVLLVYPFAIALYNFVIHKRVPLSEQQSLWTLRKLLRKIDIVWFLYRVSMCFCVSSVCAQLYGLFLLGCLCICIRLFLTHSV
jgi:hypothetical protein